MKRKIKKTVEIEVEVCERCQKNEATCRMELVITQFDSNQPGVNSTMNFCSDCSSIIERATVKRPRNRKENS